MGGDGSPRAVRQERQVLRRRVPQTVHQRAASLRETFSMCIQRTDLRYMAGRAPKGGIEREVENWLSGLLTTD